jgi:hypothetical protein
MEITKDQALHIISMPHLEKDSLNNPGYWDYVTVERDDIDHRTGRVLHFWFWGMETSSALCGYNHPEKWPRYTNLYDTHRKPKCKKCLKMLQKISLGE